MVALPQRRRFGRIEFNRPPRLRAVPRERRVELPAPPAPPAGPSGSTMGMLVIPLVATVVTSSVFVLFALTASGGQQTLMLIAAVALVAGAALPMAWLFFEDRRRIKRERRRQTEDYRRRLHNREAELLQLRAEEQSIRLEHDPDAATLLERARTLHRQLWERRPVDDDFLTIRLGLGLTRSDLELAFAGNGEPDSSSDLAQEARQVMETFTLVPDVPIVADLRLAVAVGLTGPVARTSALARAVLCQAATHHSPDEVVVVGFLSEETLDEWAWLKWLPHTRPQRASESGLTLLAWDEPGRERLARWLLNELANRRRAVAEATSAEQAPTFPWLLVFVDDFTAVRAEAAFQLALAEGTRLSVALLGLAPTLNALPRGCGGVSAFESRPGGLLTYTNTGTDPHPIQCVADAVGPEEAETIARALAAVTVVQDAGRATGDLPERVSLFDALDIPTIERHDVAAGWQDASAESLLKIPIGQVADGKLLTLDFKEQALGGQGPHGLVAGTTGAGKSELLLTIIAGLALRHPPDVVNFVLVDYKGGDAFRAVVDLPHTVDLITDLDEQLANRALVFLTSELKQRERRLAELRSSGVGSVAEYQAIRGDRPMPLLVIVVDEFARLKAELPEFVHGLVDVARVGRSLGVHLILATQTPSGTVDEEIKKNTNFGICLRVRDPSDSRDVIGEPDAFLLPGTLPGRAYFRAGQDPVQLFQTARVGARYRPRAEDEPVTLTSFPPSAHGDAGDRDGVADFPGGTAGATTEVDVLVRRLIDVAAEQGCGARRWPAPLPDEITLLPGPGASRPGAPGAGTATDGVPALLPMVPWDEPGAGRSRPDWLVVPIGLVDEPRHQTQGPFRLDLSRNVVVYGGAGSGKSSLLRTVATSLALTHSPDDVQLFAVDFGARALRPLRRLPHCGPDGVFFATETDRIRRLFRYLSSQLAQRREAGIVNLRQQRAAGAAGVPPFVVVLLDNYAGFRETFEAEEMARSHEHLLDDLATLMRDGPAAGIVFALTATQIGGIASGVENAAEVRLVLRQKDPADYALVGRFEKPPVRVPPGRGFAAGAVPLEFQVALPPPDDAADAAEGGSEWADLMTDLSRHWQQGTPAGAGRRPSPVQDLPRWIALDDARLRPAIPRGSGGANGDAVRGLPRQPIHTRQPVLPITLGLDDETLGPLRVDLAEAHHLIVTGPPASGKTTLLLTSLLSSLATPVGRRAQWYLVTPRDSALTELSGHPNCAGRVGDVTALTELLTELEDEMATRRERQRESDTGSSDTDSPGSPDERGPGQVERRNDGRNDDPEPRVLIVVDDYDVLRQDDEDESGLAETQLINLAKRGRLAGLHILVAGYNVELRRYNQQLAQHIAQTGAGALLQPDLDADGELFGGVRLRRFSQGEPPPGRGYFVYRQQLRLFQAATPLEAGPLGDGPREAGADVRAALRRRLATPESGMVFATGPGAAP